MFTFLYDFFFGSSGKYGDIMYVKTKGASQTTANQDKLSYDGVPASNTMAETDVGRMKKYKTKISNVADSFGIDPAIIAAIISRESRAGNTLHDGYGDWDQKRKKYNAFGLMQVDVNPKGGNHKERGSWNSETHIKHGTEILIDFIEKIKEKFPDWTKEQQLKGGLAAYNVGDRKVDPPRDRNGKIICKWNVDENTTGKDYSNDVAARAQWYKENFSFK